MLHFRAPAVRHPQPARMWVMLRLEEGSLFLLLDARLANLSQDLHVPRVVLVRVHGSLGRQEMKRRELDVRKGCDGPRVSPVGVGILARQRLSMGIAVEQGAELAVPFSSFCKGIYRLGQGSPRCGSHGRVLPARALGPWRTRA